MKTNVLVGALVAAGAIGGAAATAWHQYLEAPFAKAHAAPAIAAGVAAPAANPASSALPLTGFTDLVRRYGPAVVNLSVEGTRTASAEPLEIPGLENSPFRDFFRGFRLPTPRGDFALRGQGSGFIVSPDGYILTNAHVVDKAGSVRVKLTDRREFKARVIGTDKQTDIAVLKIDASNLPTVKLGRSGDANVGEWVVAIGSPFGFENSVSAGIVSAKARSLPDAAYVPFLQTDVAVNPGNSGGPLFNLAGEVIGINSQIYSRTGSFSGISFAIPIEVALNVKDQLVKHGKVSRSRIAVTVQEVDAALAESFGLDRPRGALVSSVEPGGPGDKAGLQAGDVILKYDGKPIERSSDLPMLVAETAAGKRASLEVWRQGATRSLAIATAEADAERRTAERGSDAASGRLGLSVRPLTPEERERLKGRGGVRVEEVSGAAQRAGIQAGDIVLAVNGKPVKSPEELRDLAAKGGKVAALLVQRDDRQIFVPVERG